MDGFVLVAFAVSFFGIGALLALWEIISWLRKINQNIVGQAHIQSDAINNVTHWLNKEIK